jgi:hypothetical protein
MPHVRLDPHRGSARLAAGHLLRPLRLSLSQQAEQAYLRLVSDWKTSRPAKDGAGAAPGRASQRPSKGKESYPTRREQMTLDFHP